MPKLKRFRADLHLHSVLSPCADLTMSPPLVFKKAEDMKLDIIAITDHQSVENYPAFDAFPQRKLVVWPGMELTTQEEIHVLAYFPDYETARGFGKLVYRSLPGIKNKPEKLGCQYVINESEEIIREEPLWLNQATSLTLEEAVSTITRFEGVAVPAHIDKKRYSLLSQLGFIPPDLNVAALEVFFSDNIEKYMKDYTVIQSSDAHSVELVGSKYSILICEEPTFSEFKKCLNRESGRRIELP